MLILKEPRGRTGNVLLQNVGLSVLSKYYNLKPFGYINLEYFKKINLKVNFEGREVHPEQYLDDYTLTNFITVNEYFDQGIVFDGGFQLKDFLLKFRNEIRSSFDLQYTDSCNDDLFIHVRLGDVQNHNPGLEFYRESIKSLKFNKGFISSDSPTHPMVQQLIDEFRLSQYTNSDPLETINFAKNFKNIITSKGTFSWWIAFLSQAENIIVPIGDAMWYGDIFVFDDWTYVPIK